MPIIKSAIKRMHQTAKRRARNIKVKSSLKAALKAFGVKVSNENLQKAQSEIDRAVKKNLLNKNTAARMKSQLSSKAKAAKVKPVAKKAAAKPTAKKAATPAKKSTTAKTATKKSSK